jgi:hypothetical protein
MLNLFVLARHLNTICALVDLPLTSFEGIVWNNDIVMHNLWKMVNHE